MRMQLQDLEVFLAVARKGTLAAAVDDVHRTPSALSKCIRRLEEALGTELFDRSGARLQLSPAGERLRTRAQHLVDLGQELERDARASTRPSVVIAGPPLLLWRFSADLVRRYRGVYPQGRVDLRSMYETDAASAVAQGEIDVAVVTSKAHEPSLEALEWGQLDAVVASASLDAAVAGRPPLACLGASPLLRASRAHALPRDGIGTAELVADDLMVLAELVSSGLAIAELPAFLVERLGLKAHKSSAPHGVPEAVSLVRRPGTARWLTCGIGDARAA
jgi:DNA-binding transcriptional LysR family regulator